MEFLLVFAIVVAIGVVPVMIAARMLGARNTGFGSALLAVIIAAAVGAAVEALVGEGLIGIVVSLGVGAFVYAGVLGTTFWRGLGISILSTLILLAVVLVLASVLSGTGVVEF